MESGKGKSSGSRPKKLVAPGPVQVFWPLRSSGAPQHDGRRFDYRQDENNTEYFEFIETLTYQSGLSAKPRRFLPKMFATVG